MTPKLRYHPHLIDAMSTHTGSAAVRTRYPDGSSWWWVRVYELRDGRIARSTEYFAQDFDAPEWRGPWVERTGTTRAEYSP